MTIKILSYIYGSLTDLEYHHQEIGRKFEMGAKLGVRNPQLLILSLDISGCRTCVLTLDREAGHPRLGGWRRY
jgi:hypothetical protein